MLFIEVGYIYAPGLLLDAMDVTPSEMIYPPSGRKILSLAIFLLLWSWILLKRSHTDDEVVHKLCIAGAVFFAAGAGYFVTQFLRGVPRLVLNPEGFIWETGLEAYIRLWSECEGFSVGHSFGPIETISFIRTDTGADAAILNTTRVPAYALCEEMSRWRVRYARQDEGQQGA